MPASDQNFKTQYGADLIGENFPFNPFNRQGDPSDVSYYVLRPGVDFLRPWLAIRGGAAFQWPLGMEGFSVQIDPTLGIHKFMGDNAVNVDVVHNGQEGINLSGTFPGTQNDPDNDAAIQAFRNLREMVYRDTPTEGKILFVPLLMSNAQRVVVEHAEFSRSSDQRGTDMSYSIDFVRTGIAAPSPDVTVPTPQPQPTVGPRGNAARNVHVDAKHNTLRKIAAWKLGGADQWRSIFDKNRNYFTKKGVIMAKVPDYKMPQGTVVYY